MSLYALNAAIEGATTGCYCSVTLTSGALVDGVGECMPTQLAFTYMSFQGAITFQVPAGDTSCGGTVSATTPTIAGSVIVSPPVNVPTVITVWGVGKVLGSYSLPAGQSNGQFSFNVNGSDAIPEDQVGEAMKQFVKGGSR
jgi:hypothetical protein